MNTVSVHFDPIDLDVYNLENCPEGGRYYQYPEPIIADDPYYGDGAWLSTFGDHHAQLMIKLEDLPKAINKLNELGLLPQLFEVMQ